MTGEIDGNTATNGGGMYIANGVVNMTAGSISNNKATGAIIGGAGVYLSKGSFNLRGG